MRLLTHILLLFVLAVSVIPCSSMDDCCDDEIEQSACHDDHEEESQSCTPFCVCSHCSNVGFVWENPNFYIPFQTTQTTLLATEYRSQFSSSYFHSFWQPPKLKA